MLPMALIVFAACVLTVLFWAAVVAAAGVVLGALWLILKALWWLVTRPIVWLIIRPIEFIFGVKHDGPTSRESAATKVLPGTTAPSVSRPSSPSSMTEKVEQLATLKSLLEGGAINQDEFDRMKTQVIGN
jgi:hypothetical protein